MFNNMCVDSLVRLVEIIRKTNILIIYLPITLGRGIYNNCTAAAQAFRLT